MAFRGFLIVLAFAVVIAFVIYCVIVSQTEDEVMNEVNKKQNETAMLKCYERYNDKERLDEDKTRNGL